MHISWLDGISSHQNWVTHLQMNGGSNLKHTPQPSSRKQVAISTSGPGWVKFSGIKHQTHVISFSAHLRSFNVKSLFSALWRLQLNHHHTPSRRTCKMVWMDIRKRKIRSWILPWAKKNKINQKKEAYVVFWQRESEKEQTNQQTFRTTVHIIPKQSSRKCPLSRYIFWLLIDPILAATPTLEWFVFLSDFGKNFQSWCF